MIRIVHPTAEADEYGMRIPLSALYEGGELTVHAYPEAEQAARELMALSPFPGFTDGVLDRLDEMLRPLMEEQGYLPEEGYTRQVSYLYRLDRIEQLNTSLIRADSGRFSRREGLIYDTETVLDEQSDACPIFATVIQDHVCSFANLNADDGEVAEIGVETSPDHRKNGYGASNVAALSRYLLEQGREGVIYLTLSDNPASIALAERVGFVRVGEEYNYVCFEKEEKDGI